jgi:phosphoserine phosphatase
VEAAFFDLDKTVIAKASIAAFGRTFYRGGLISRSTVLRALVSQFVYLHLGANEQKLARVRESVLELTKGWDQQEVSRLVREALDDIIEPIIYLGARGSIASKAVVDADGRYTGEMGFYAYGPFKAEAMSEVAEREGIDLSASYAYTDSYTDAPMLELVGHPVAVNPDRVLARLARERGWEVAAFTRPVRMRDRLPVPSRTATATGAAVVAVATGAAVVAWRFGQRPRSTG